MNDVSAIAAISPLPSGADSILLQVNARKPPMGAVAVVLDFSDSCDIKQTELTQCEKLLMSLPRSWPLWLYCLSNHRPLVELESLSRRRPARREI